MWQELEGQKPVVIYRNLNARTVPNTAYRWQRSSDWDLTWNFQRGAIFGGVYGVTAAVYKHIREPTQDMLKFYQAPDNLAQLKTYVKEVMGMENFKRGFLSRLSFEVSRGMVYNTMRLGIWKCIAGGFWTNPDGVDIYWHKNVMTAIACGVASGWVTPLWYNLDIRFRQDKILPKEMKRGYRNHLHALLSILKNDGFYPLIRSFGPIYAEAIASTTGMLTTMDFITEKTRHFEYMGSAYPAYNPNVLKTVNILSAIVMANVCSKPFNTLRKVVENVPQNSKGQRMFTTYTEAFGKYLGEYYFLMNLYQGFWKQTFKTAPQMFVALWIGESLGLFKKIYYPSAYIEESE